MNSKVVYNTTRCVLGALFLFSGFAKGVNPFGLSLQFDSYFTVMGLDVLAPLGPLAAVALPAGELWLGFLLLFGRAERATRWAAGGVMLFFTGLTLWIALENPVEDCGCFGELWKISNWATFWKNVLFLAVAVGFFLTTSAERRGSKRRGYLSLTLGLAVVSVGLPLWCWGHLPLVETSPWAVGRDVRAEMGSTLVEQSESQLVYRNNISGDEHLFSLSDTTWQDDTLWTYLRTETQTHTSGTQGALAQVAFLSVQNDENVARAVFDTPGTVVLVVVPDPAAISPQQTARLCVLVDRAREQKAFVACVTSTLGAEPLCGLPYLLADRSLLYAMMPHSVGGVLVLEEGVVRSKSVF